MERLTLLLDLKALRVEAGLTAEQVAQQSGVALPAYRVIERGATPSLEASLKIARYLELNVEYIWGLREVAEPEEGKET